jgi:predicted dehydrogenase
LGAIPFRRRKEIRTMNPMKDTYDISRRAFLAAGAASAVSTSMFGAASSTPRVIGANDRLRVGVIGAGGMATAHMKALVGLREKSNLEIVAVCDLYQKRLDAAVEMTGGKPYKDYRKLLENKDLDYVTIATPEHWHAQMTLDAAEEGLHIYCEKPMTYSIEEGKQVVERIKESGVKMQVGVQGMSDDSYETAAKHIKDGAIGKVVMAHIDYSRNYENGDFFTSSEEPDSDARPGENLDWEAFLGPAKKRPWNPDRFFQWRRYWDYSGGIATDLLVHRLTRIVKALGLTTPARVVATGGKNYFTDSPAEIPDTFNVLIEYPEGINVLLVSSMANGAQIRHIIRGYKGTLEFTKEGFLIEPDRRTNPDAKPLTHTKTGSEDIALHHQNLHDAIRNGAELRCGVDLGFYGALPCQMAVESFREREYLSWYRRREKVVKA